MTVNSREALADTELIDLSGHPLSLPNVFWHRKESTLTLEGLPLGSTCYAPPQELPSC
jgi:hypothetical protein